MEKHIHKIRLFTNKNEKSEKIEKELTTYLEQYGFEIVEKGYELAIAIGGDGSFLRMVKENNFDSEIYYVGVNTGTLGFLQEVRKEEILPFVEKLASDQFHFDSLGIQETVVTTKNSSSHFYSLNEIVIREKELNTVALKVAINEVELESFVGDGILIATSVGSTAYNLSYGGSMVYPSLHTLQITPIAPLNSKAYRDLLNSVIVPENKIITLRPRNDKRGLLITVDGENNEYTEVEKIETVVKDKRIFCLRMENYDFATIVHEKFVEDN